MSDLPGTDGLHGPRNSKTMKRKRSTNGIGETKKLTAACTACRKQKIKCEMENETPPCTRCERRGISCVLHTAQRHTVVEQKQFGLLSKDLTNIFSTLKQVCHHLNLEPPSPLVSEQDAPKSHQDGPSVHDELSEDGEYEVSPPMTPLDVQAPIDTYLTSAQQENGGDPSSPQRPRLRRKASERPDLISKGLISREDANNLVGRYLSHLDRFLYGLASQFKDVDQVRRSSPTLLAAMCATAAFQDVNYKGLFEVCNREYQCLVKASMFENRNVDFIRALCIGSFWLPDASRLLSSEAIRRAADCRLHVQFYRLTEPPGPERTPTDPAASLLDARDKTRLWYLLYICDQHLSILHNHDPLMRQEKAAINNRDLFLADRSTASFSQDIRLISQVELLAIMGQIRDTLGDERNGAVSKTLLHSITHFAKELDRWYTSYSSAFEPDPYIGSFPLAGLTMHYHFGKLYLGHHIFRGLGPDPIPPHFLPMAAAARDAAVAIFALIPENEAFRNNIVGMPHYFHIMILFAGHFLLEVCMKYREQLDAVVEEDFRRVSNAMAVFARTPTLPQHPIARVTSGLMRKLSEYTSSLGMESFMTESPFANYDWAAEQREITHDLANGSAGMPTGGSMDMQFTGFPTDVFYAGLGNPIFPDPQFQFGGMNH